MYTTIELLKKKKTDGKRTYLGHFVRYNQYSHRNRDEAINELKQHEVGQSLAHRSILCQRQQQKLITRDGKSECKRQEKRLKSKAETHLSWGKNMNSIHGVATRCRTHTLQQPCPAHSLIVTPCSSTCSRTQNIYTTIIKSKQTIHTHQTCL